MAFYHLLTAFGAWIASLPLWVQLPFGAIYILIVPLLMVGFAVSLTARGRAADPKGSAAHLLWLSRPRTFWMIWIGLLLVCIVETLLCVATYGPGTRLAIMDVLDALVRKRDRGIFGVLPLVGVIAGIWSIFVLPRARRFALGEDDGE